ncbi:MAG: NADH-quinone oxidoreductase subunit D, partial [Bacteroidetes bacterium]|nr:NADH-quinone oxidoreductase subunit D [Bacteroidota bacterium]
MGPQHPATHGVLNLLLTIDGEIIQKVEPDLGYIHRSIEKMCERDSYQQRVHVTDRMDSLSSNINNEAVCLVVKNALELEVPERVKVIRAIIRELTRIS